jgi:hypothetical protein
MLNETTCFSPLVFCMFNGVKHVNDVVKKWGRSFCVFRNERRNGVASLRSMEDVDQCLQIRISYFLKYDVYCY